MPATPPAKTKDQLSAQLQIPPMDVQKVATHVGVTLPTNSPGDVTKITQFVEWFLSSEYGTIAQAISAAQKAAAQEPSAAAPPSGGENLWSFDSFQNAGETATKNAQTALQKATNLAVAKAQVSAAVQDLQAQRELQITQQRMSDFIDEGAAELLMISTQYSGPEFDRQAAAFWRKVDSFPVMKLVTQDEAEFICSEIERRAKECLQQVQSRTFGVRRYQSIGSSAPALGPAQQLSLAAAQN